MIWFLSSEDLSPAYSISLTILCATEKYTDKTRFILSPQRLILCFIFSLSENEEKKWKKKKSHYSQSEHVN